MKLIRFVKLAIRLMRLGFHLRKVNPGIGSMVDLWNELLDDNAVLRLRVDALRRELKELHAEYHANVCPLNGFRGCDAYCKSAREVLDL